MSARPDPLAAILDEPVDWRFKGFGRAGGRVTVGEVGAQHWNVLRGDLELPLLTLREDALAHNIQAMAAYADAHGVSLAPHGKTTMAPQLAHRQLAAGAWAITAATVAQARVFRAFGVDRIVLANQLVDVQGLRWAAAETAADPGFAFVCLVDSVRGVQLMEGAWRAAGAARPLDVLLEVGAAGGRAGVRAPAEADAVAAAVARSAALRLVGVDAFEGVLGGDRGDATLAAVDALVDAVADAARRVDARGGFADAGEVILTAGGSVFFDRIVALTATDLTRPVRVVLRSGCSVTHDHGAYASGCPLDPSRAGDAGLRPALELWAEVLSRPEPQLAIVGFGRRDAPFDAGLPTPLRVVPRDGGARPAAGLGVTALNDQHAFVDGAAELAVGDRICFGISHPCTAFDKWALLPLVTPNGDVTGAVRTFF